MKTHIFDTEDGYLSFLQISNIFTVFICEDNQWKVYQKYEVLSSAALATKLAREAGFQTILHTESVFEYTPTIPLSVSVPAQVGLPL